EGVPGDPPVWIACRKDRHPESELLGALVGSGAGGLGNLRSPLLAGRSLHLDLARLGRFGLRERQAQHAILEGGFGPRRIDIDRQRQGPLERTAWQFAEIPRRALGVIGLRDARD